MPRLIPPLILFAALFLLTACGDDATVPPPGDGSSAEGTLTPSGPDFALEIEFAAGPDSLRRGPFLLRGRNLHYNDVIGALIVEFTLTNVGEAIHPEPVVLHFFRLIPDGTLILNSPDDSPFFPMEFANDDGVWTPGEESLPREVMFKANLGQSVGFNAQVMFRPEEPGPSISGRVWLDANRDGVMQPDERGIPRIPLVVDDGGPREILRRVTTDADGRFLFPDLYPGTWEVRVQTIPDGLRSTTPSSMHVLLAGPVGGGGGFDRADFGFAEIHPPVLGPELFVIGDSLGTVHGLRGETTATFAVTAGFPLNFRWRARSGDPEAPLAWIRHGWDLADPGDPHDPGWEVPAGLAHENYFSPEKAFRSGLHTLTVDCADAAGNRTRVIVRIEVVLR